MTIDEAINDYKKMAEQHEKWSEYKWFDNDEWNEESRKEHLKCAADQRKLAELLIELKRLRVQNRLLLKYGRWEQIGEQSARCNNCGGVLKSNGVDKSGKALIFNAVYHYCPFCGADMRISKECEYND